MKNFRKGVRILLAVLMLLCALTACNSNQGSFNMAGSNSDTPQNDSEKGAGTQIMPGITEQQPQHFIVQPGQLGKMGEPVGAMDVQNGKAVTDALFYTINKATMFENIDKANIELEAMSSTVADESLLDGNGELKSSVKFLLVELTMQNVSAEPDRNITDLSILCADTDSISDGNP